VPGVLQRAQTVRRCAAGACEHTWQAAGMLAQCMRS
jgi:hypothetical protein